MICSRSGTIRAPNRPIAAMFRAILVDKTCVAYETLQSRYKSGRTLRRVFLQPRDRHRPRLLRRFHVRTIVAGLRSKEAVRGAVEDVRLVRFAECLHLRVRRRDGVAD